MRNWRLFILALLVFCVAATMFGRLFYLQVLSRKFYYALALGQQTGFKEVKGQRGEVFLANSKENRGAYGVGEAKSLAINKDEWTVFAIPKHIENRDDFARLIAHTLQETPENILAKLAQSETYAVLQKNAPAQLADQLRGLKLKGLYFEAVDSRYYPQEALAAQLIGFLGGESGEEGQYGIEGHYEEILQGKSGIKEEKAGLALIGAGQAPSLDGSDLYLTIDYNIQFQAEQLLKEAARDINIDSGQIVVLKPDSGRVLALANWPAYNPNQYSKVTDYDIFQNSAVQKIFEPGSVFKPFTMAMALNEGKVTPESTYHDTGSVTIGPNTIYNFNREKYGAGNMSRILEKSINTGAVFLSQTISHETFMDYLERLGFNEKTGIDVQGEIYSKNEILKTGSDFGFATSSFGQGIEMTPIQLARAFCVFANGGKLVKPYVVEKIVHDGEELVTKPEVSGQVISEKTASQVASMLTNVVEHGFGNGAKIEGYYLAGKTGTAEVPIRDGKGYYADRTIQSFIGFGPSLNPQFLILVKLDNPSVPKSALSAVPIFKKLAQYMINYWQIPPDY